LLAPLRALGAARRFARLAGRGVSRPTRAGIEAVLADLAGYA
jgi:hypothetical protein